MAGEVCEGRRVSLERRKGEGGTTMTYPRLSMSAIERGRGHHGFIAT